MPHPIAICIEDLSATPSTYLSCVAVGGTLPGLRLDEAGHVLWQSERSGGAEIWVSGDEQLMLFRPEPGQPVRVYRAGRHVDAPVGKPVVLLDRDELTIGPRRLRVHVHGPAPAVVAPSPVVLRAAGLAASAASLVAMGAVVAACDREIEVRDAPPTVSELTDGGPAVASSGSGGAAEDAGTPDAAASATEAATSTATSSSSTPVPVHTNRPIEVRPSPPKMAAPEPPEPAPPPPKPVR